MRWLISPKLLKSNSFQILYSDFQRIYILMKFQQGHVLYPPDSSNPSGLRLGSLCIKEFTQGRRGNAREFSHNIARVLVMEIIKLIHASFLKLMWLCDEVVSLETHKGPELSLITRKQNHSSTKVQSRNFWSTPYLIFTEKLVHSASPEIQIPWVLQSNWRFNAKIMVYFDVWCFL